MIRVFGILFLLLIIEIPFLLTDLFIKNGFLTHFLVNQSTIIMGTILALNVTTASFLLTHLTSIEVQSKKIIFDASAKEIKQQLFFMIGIFLVHIFVLTATPQLSDRLKTLYYILRSLNLLLFLVFLYGLYEIIKAIFIIRHASHKHIEIETLNNRTNEVRSQHLTQGGNEC